MVSSTFVALTDLSPQAHRAAYLTALLAGAVGADLVLLHLPIPPVLEPELGLVLTPADELLQEHDTEAALAAVAERLPVPATVYRAAGGVHDALQALQQRRPLQLLALGLAPEHDLLDQLLRNHVLPALRDTHLPLLLVPAAAAQDPALPRQLAVAVDGDAFELTPEARHLVAALGRWHPTYTVVHVAEPQAAGQPAMQRALAAARRGGAVPAGAPGGSYQVRQASRSAGIVQAAADIQADLLVLVARPRSLLRSLFPCRVTGEVMRLSSIPLLLLPAADSAAGAPERQAVDGLLY
ncbi:hypothetical protein GCM10027048_21150 [Hymenobacter coalescens]